MNAANSSPPPTSQSSISSNPITNSRSRKQLSLFVAGASFFLLSGVITRRSLHRRYAASVPKFYQPSNRPGLAVNGAMEGFEALNIATINVTSFMIMMTGGLLWAFDISSMDEMRRKIRGGLGVDGTGRSETDAEQAFEEWLAGVMGRKEEKESRKEQSGDDVRRNERGRPR